MSLDSVGVLIGRFQTDHLHEGHLHIIDKVYNGHTDTIIFLGVAAFPSKGNPLDFYTRYKMIKQRYPNALVMALKDQRSDQDWSNEIDRRVLESFPFRKAILYGGRDNCFLHYKGHLEYVGIEVKKEMSDVSSSARRVALSRITLNEQAFRHGVIYGAENRFPQVMPTVDVAILYMSGNREPQVLLGQRKNEDKPRFVGGFVDVSDPSMEHAAIREVEEETGIKIVEDKIYILATAKINDWRVKAGQSIMTTLFVATTSREAALIAKAADDIGSLVHIPLSKFEPFDVVPEHRELCQNNIERIQKAVVEKRIVL